MRIISDAKQTNMNDILDNLIRLFTYHPQEPLIFSSGLFLFLFLGFSLVYLFLRRRLTARLLFVTAFSYYFYYKSSGMYFCLLALVTVSDYYLARLIHKSRSRNGNNRFRTRALLALSIVTDLSLLVYFKYTNFFAGIVADIMGQEFQPWDIFLPVGISFFTFQSLSYTIDVYRGKLAPLPSLLDYAFFVSFFPQLVAGPIVRASDFVPQIRKPLRITGDMFGRGIYFILIGLFKKAVISDYISLNFVDRIFDDPSLYSGVENLLGLYGYAIQLYCDFSGYSDMAIGLAFLLGFRFPLNFNAPYKAESVADFWRRWHISLSSWIRDYVYISLGGNRRGALRNYWNLFITMVLCGLWHGAAMNFVLWGAIHGAACSVHRFFRTKVFRHDRHYHSQGIKRFFAVFITFHFWVFTCMFFRNTSFDNIYTQLHQLFYAFRPELLPDVISGYRYALALIALGFLTHYLPDSLQERAIAVIKRCNIIVCALFIVALIYIVIQMKSSDIQPFIYFQF